ncbi:ribonuclease H-like domain-containing protein [Tanacetum coccineum]|uniref:Ribonuclease H-like domain-containing protein n=1 Tax=Tanacetum coccineum TaxID=301880 RepID=A0ABQ5FDK3_9ASTR
MDVTTIVTPSNVKTVESNHESADVKSNGDAVELKTVRKNSFRPPVIKDWNSDDDSEVEFISNLEDKTVRPSTKKIKFVKSAKETVEKHLPNMCDKRVIRPVWNNTSRVNHNNFANKMTHPHPNRRFFPQAVLTKSSKINTAGASVNTAVRLVNTAGSKTTMSLPRPISNAYKKGYSQVTRPFNKYSENKNSLFNKKVNTVKVKDTTVRDKAVVSENKGKGVNGVKASACCVWKAKNSSASNNFKKYSYIDARGRSKSIMALGSQKSLNSLILLCRAIHSQEGVQGIGDGKGRISRKGKIKTGTLDCDNVYFCKELKYNLFSVLQICVKKNNVLFTDTECLVLSSDLKLLDEKVSLRLIDESNLWHRRLGHINLKNMNKLVRENLVRVVTENQTNGIAGTKDNIVAGQAEKKIEPEQEYILIPFCTTDPLISQGPKDSEEDVSMKPTEVNESGASDKGEEDEQDTRSKFERPLQQEKQTNSTNSFNNVGTLVSAAGPSFTNDDPSSPVNAAEASNAFEDHLFERFYPFKNAFALPHVPNVFSIDDTGIFGNAYDDEDVGAEADLNNLETTMNVSPIPTTRIDKDHPKDQIIGDLNSAI